MWYRIGAVRNMTGGRKTDPSTKMTDKLKTVRNILLQILLKLEKGLIVRFDVDVL